MSLGMSYSDYWDGDPGMPRYYRVAWERQMEIRNYQAWLNGLYIYHALQDVSPLLNPMSKRKKAHKYLKEPIPTTKRASKQADEEENRRKMKEGKQAMRSMMTGINAKMKRGGGKNGS